MGELKTLKGCDWNLEIGAITEIVAHKEDGPAVLFEDIKGYPKGYRVLSNSLSSRKRLALTLGLPAGDTKMDFVKIWKDNYKKVKPIPPKFVKKSGLFDNVYRDGDIDMFKFPDALSGMTKTAAAISAPAASISRVTRTKAGSTTAPTGS